MAILPNYKDIVELLKKGSTIEAQEKILELREAALELQEENLSLRERVKELEGVVAKQAAVIWEKPSYWTQDGDVKDGPFCQACYDKNNQLIRLQGGKNGTWHCKVCSGKYYDSTYKSPVVASQPSSNRWRI